MNSRVSAVVLSLLAFVTFFCGVSLAAADPVRVTSGLVEAGFGPLGEPWNAESLYLTGAGFSIGSSLEDEDAFVHLATLPTVAAGTLIDLSGVLRVRDTIGGLLDDSFALVEGPFELSFDASATPLACSSVGSSTECTGIAPFTFDAVLTFTPWGGVSVTRHLTGGGTAEGSLFRLGSFEAGGVRYVFESSAVPEPATVALFVAGAIVAGPYVRHRRRRMG